MKRLVCLCAILFAFCVWSAALSETNQGDANIPVRYTVECCYDMAREMLPLINELRTADGVWQWNADNTTKSVFSGIAPLEYDAGLEYIAMQRAAELAIYYDHTRPDGTSCFTIYRTVGLSNFAGAENICYGFSTAERSLNAFWEENQPYEYQGHRRNLLNSKFVKIGIGCVKVNGVYYWAQEFSSRGTETGGGQLETDFQVSVMPWLLSNARLKAETAEISLYVGETVDLPKITGVGGYDNSGRTSFTIVEPNWQWQTDSDRISIAGNQVTGLSAGQAAVSRQLVTYDEDFSLYMDEDITILVWNDPEDSPEGILIDEANFPDEAFRDYIKEKIDSDENEILTEDEIKAITRLHCDTLEIETLKGIEYFTELTELNCRNIRLTSLDLHTLTSLTKLNCAYNALTALDVSNNPALVSLLCHGNQLSSLNVSRNQQLETLECEDNSLSELDVSNCPVLRKTVEKGFIERWDGGLLFYYGTSDVSVDEKTSLIGADAGNDFTDRESYYYEPIDDNSIMITACKLEGNISIPEQIAGCTVRSLDSRLFCVVRGITSVTIPSTVQYFGFDASDNMWDYVFSYCYDLESIYVSPDNPVFCSVDGVLYSKDQRTLYSYPCAKPGSTYHVPAQVREICCRAFASAQHLTSLYLDGPNTIWYTYAFYDDGDLTVHYPADTATAECAERFIQNGYSHESDSAWNRYHAIGDVDDPAMLPGDVNGDEAVDGRDLLRLARFIAGQHVTIDEKAADINEDGKVDGRDLLRLAKQLAGG